MPAAGLCETLPAPDTPEFIGEYRVLRVLGAGAMGEVFLVQHPRLPRSDALKLLNVTVSRDQQFEARFKREADLLAQLQHPNIITVYDRGEFAGRLWLAMEYIPGQDVAQLLRSYGALPVALAFPIIAGAGAALDYAYAERHITHRDVKPANILVTFDRDGQLRTVKLADFGIAKTVGDATSVTETGVAIGTMAYISPEAIAGQPLDNRADLYSLAATAFELLTGRPPFTAPSLPAMMMAHLSQPVPAVTAINPSLPPHFDEVFRRALAKDPAARFENCAQFVHALSGALPAPVYPVPPRRRRRSVVAALAVLAAVATVVAAVPFAAKTGRAGRPDRHSHVAAAGDTGHSDSPVDIDRLLLGAAEINKVMGRDDMAMTARSDRAESEEIAQAVRVTPAECANTGEIPRAVLVSDAVRQQRNLTVDAPTDDFRSYVDQLVVQATSEDGAADIFDQQAVAWQRCVDRDLTQQDQLSDLSFNIRFSEFSRNDDRVSVARSSREAPQGHVCDMILAHKFGYLIQVSACGYGVAGKAATVVDALLSRVTSAAQGPVAAPLPVLDDRLLDAGQGSGFLGYPMKPGSPVRNSLSAPPGPKGTISPAECATLALLGTSPGYSSIAWLTAATVEMVRAEADSSSPLVVSQSVVMTPSSNAAGQLLSATGLAWGHCERHAFHVGGQEAYGFNVREVVTSTPDMIYSRSTQTVLPTYEARHTMAIKGSYVVEVYVIGKVDPDVQAVTRQLLDRLPN